MKALIFLVLALTLGACGGSVPCAQAGGTGSSVCGAGMDMACHADCGTQGVCCLPDVNGQASDCH
jgi:hypothetical protein